MLITRAQFLDTPNLYIDIMNFAMVKVITSSPQSLREYGVELRILNHALRYRTILLACSFYRFNYSYHAQGKKCSIPIVELEKGPCLRLSFSPAALIVWFDPIEKSRWEGAQWSAQIRVTQQGELVYILSPISSAVQEHSKTIKGERSNSHGI